MFSSVQLPADKLRFVCLFSVGDKCVPNNEIRNGVCAVIMDCEDALRSG